MNVAVEWNSGLQFKGSVGEHEVLMDTVAPLGADTAASPKQLLLMAVCGCSGMDVISLLKKHKQNVESFSMFTNPTAKETQPKIYTDLHINYELEGEIDPKIAFESVQLSMTKYCSVSAMVSKVVKITYTVEVNGQAAGEGAANFSL
jgi:putative redox protein